MNLHPPRSIIVLLVSMAAIVIGGNFLKGVGMAGAAQIAPSVVASQNQQAPIPMSLPAAPAATVQAQTQTSSQVQTTPPNPSTPIVQPSTTAHHERAFRKDD